MRAPDRLCQRPTDIDHLQLRAALQLLPKRHRVRHDDRRQNALVDVIDRRPAEDAVRDDGHDLARAVLLHHGGGLSERAARVGHVVDQNAHFVDHLADQHHAADLVGPWALLVNQREGQVQAVSERGRTLGAAGVGGDDHAVFDGEVFLDPAQDGGLGVEVVDGDVEEALDLSGIGDVSGWDSVAVGAPV